MQNHSDVFGPKLISVKFLKRNL